MTSGICSLISTVEFETRGKRACVRRIRIAENNYYNNFWKMFASNFLRECMAFDRMYVHIFFICDKSK